MDLGWSIQWRMETHWKLEDRNWIMQSVPLKILLISAGSVIRILPSRSYRGTYKSRDNEKIPHRPICTTYAWGKSCMALNVTVLMHMYTHTCKTIPVLQAFTTEVYSNAWDTSSTRTVLIQYSVHRTSYTRQHNWLGPCNLKRLADHKANYPDKLVSGYMEQATSCPNAVKQARYTHNARPMLVPTTVSRPYHIHVQVHNTKDAQLRGWTCCEGST